MKKSEKIEIRVSVDEKEALSRLALEEGRSVSQLIRDVVRKYAALNMATPRIRYMKIKIAGLICLGFLGGFAVPVLMATSGGDSAYMVHGTINNNGFGFPLSGTTAQTQTIAIGEGEQGIKFNFTIDGKRKKERRVQVSICQNHIAECRDMAAAELHLTPGSPSVWQTGGRNDENIFLVIQPVES